MKNENIERCKAIADVLYTIANGDMYRCPECGEMIPWSNAQYSNETNLYTCQHCHDTYDADDLEPFCMFDYFENALDIEYYSRGRGADDYTGVRIMIACGGPNIYVDTRRSRVELFWWNEYASRDLWSDTCEAIDEMFSDLWNC